MQTWNGRKITRRKKTTKVKTKATKVRVVEDAATKEEVVVVVVEKVVAEDKVVATMKDADSMMENIYGNYVHPTSTVQPEKLQEQEEVEAVDAMVVEVEVMDVEDMNLIMRTVIQLVVTITYLHLRITVVQQAYHHQYPMYQ